MTTTDPGHLDLERFSSLVDERLEPGERDEAERHLAACSRCQTELDELRATVALVRELPLVEPPRSFLLAEDVAAPVELGRPGWAALAGDLAPWTRVAGALAAALFVVLVSADLLNLLGGGAAQKAAPPATAIPGLSAQRPAEGPAGAPAPRLQAQPEPGARTPAPAGAAERGQRAGDAAPKPAAPVPTFPSTQAPVTTESSPADLRPWEVATGLLATFLLLASFLLRRQARSRAAGG